MLSSSRSSTARTPPWRSAPPSSSTRPTARRRPCAACASITCSRTRCSRIRSTVRSSRNARPSARARTQPSPARSSSSTPRATPPPSSAPPRRPRLWWSTCCATTRPFSSRSQRRRRRCPSWTHCPLSWTASSLRSSSQPPPPSGPTSAPRGSERSLRSSMHARGRPNFSRRSCTCRRPTPSPKDSRRRSPTLRWCASCSVARTRPSGSCASVRPRTSSP
mmetsp:Transcript_43462/g.114209  ORF Transcript_43462/g.114209 Transcript_43462/m.114209 type:complete len:220 (+) Transcript_43462:1959-2618(+)